ncbi:unnamed protein product [Protopolystoma xenopodis]|uniref:Uncharacterized protein n=1 Tax=Protopolystoma xenopodis TaxID=117903 RepID=A0A3S5ABD2_9PLAT|nr:unnamed protein product [Protopolystoma xenopodis]
MSRGLRQHKDPRRLATPSTPLVMLVIDGKERHVGQVVLPPVGIPRSGQPALVASRLHESELEPTKRNSHPRGAITYWIWTEEYWPEGTQLGGLAGSASAGKSILSKSSIFGSISRLAKAK